MKKCLYCEKKLLRKEAYYCSAQHNKQWLVEERQSKYLSGEDINLDYRTVKRILLRINGNKCEMCNNTQWLNKPIALVLDHIDGNSDNIKRENVRLICNNCDAQTDTYKGRNKGKGRYSRRQRYAEGKSY